MASLPVATNVQAAAAAGFLTAILLHVCALNNIVIPEDIADGLTGFVTILVAHVIDLMQGTNK